MSHPVDYVERVYAGVLGKIIGVYLGRPFEGWSYDRIMSELGEIIYYVHEKRGVPLVVTDDDISGTFTFIRALSDHGNCLDLTSEQIGNTWLNYLIENRTILWWGGMGNSTGHTAYLRLNKGIPAPQSGSIELNGKIVAEQVGAQIFIDGWGMVTPGNPGLASDLARRAASVSHDGEAIYGAQVIAALESQAFIEPDIQSLLDIATSFIPGDSIIYRLINQLREWHEKYPDWHTTRELIARHYGYDRYGGNCHMVPNHALIMLGLLYGEDDFQKSLMIVNTSGWDTDCNSGNLGCIMGIKNGLKGINAKVDWRGPVADRLYIAAADGGNVITDAVRVTYQIVNTARALVGEPELAPKAGARFHFELPGSVQGFHAVNGHVENMPGHSQKGSRSLAFTSNGIAQFGTPTFIPQEAIDMAGYTLMASPTLYPGQKVFAGLTSSKDMYLNFYIGVYDANDRFKIIPGTGFRLPPDEFCEVYWRIPDTGGAPVAEIGFQTPVSGTVYLDYLGWEGAPQVTFSRPSGSVLPRPGSQIWRKAWINGVDLWPPWASESFHLTQNEGMGLISTGTRQWTNYLAKTTLRAMMMKSGGLAIRIQGMRRFYALVICAGQKARLIKASYQLTTLAEVEFPWIELEPHDFILQASGNRFVGWIDGVKYFDLCDEGEPILDGAIGLMLEEGTLMAESVVVEPLPLDFTK